MGLLFPWHPVNSRECFLAETDVRNPIFHAPVTDHPSKSIYVLGYNGFIMTMNRTSQNLSRLVFRRNIPVKMETYVVNCEMIQVLAEMDGTKDVTAIATALNKTLGDMMTIFAALYRQKLIFLVKSDLPGADRPSSSVKKPLIESNKISIKNPHRAIVQQQTAGRGKMGLGDYFKKVF
jgi:hypothetical protein